MLVWKAVGRYCFILVYLAVMLYACSILMKPVYKIEIERDAQLKFKRTHPDNDFDLPLIFVGGFPRSGTTLMRTMLETNKDIRCGPETHVIPGILIQRNLWLENAKEAKRLEEAGVHPDALDIGIARFIVEIIKGHGPQATYYCNKDPLVLTNMGYLHPLFPNAKFVYVIRDGRASAHSIVTKKVKIGDMDITSYKAVLEMWNFLSEQMHSRCKELGVTICLPVHYEQLVLQPVNNTKRIFDFLDIPWSKDVLHHDRFVQKTKLSSFEVSTDQVQRPLYLDALTSWFGHIPPGVERDMHKIAPMLKVLGYNPDDPHPNYGEPDDFVTGKLKL